MRWDWDAIRAGAMVALVFAVPFSIAGRWAADSRDDSTLAVWLNLGAVVGFVLGAGCAAWVQRVGTPLSHGLVTAVGTYLAAQAVFVRHAPGPRPRRALVCDRLQPHRRPRRRSPRRAARPAPAQPGRPAREPSVTAILVLDVGTTSVRAAIVDERLQIVAMARRPFPPATPFPGLVEFDAAELVRIVLDAAARGDGVGRSDRRRRHHQPAGEHDRVGSGDRRADRAGARLAGPAHRRRVHRRPGRARPDAGAEPVGDQGRLVARPRRGRA